MKFESNPNDYETVSLLGKCCGHIGIVLLAKHKRTTLVAVKKFDLEKAIDEYDLCQIQKEIVIARQLRNSYILSYECTFINNQSLWAVSQLCGYGSCTDLIASHFPEGLPELAICYIMCDVLNGLAYIHRKGFIHRAIRASHILITAQGKAVITGLRYACQVVKNGKRRRVVHSFPSSTALNINWLSPEVLEQNLEGYNEKSDIYSLGITSIELANGCVPFSDISATLMLTEKVRGCTPQLIDCSTYSLYETRSSSDDNLMNGAAHASNCAKSTRSFSDNFHQFTDLCLLKDVELRPGATHLLNHSFLKQLKQRNIPVISELLHPVMPLVEDSIQTDTDDVTTILAHSNKMAEVQINSVEWEF